jgi:subtilisin family serine protease
MRSTFALIIVTLFMTPLAGAIGLGIDTPQGYSRLDDSQLLPSGYSNDIPLRTPSPFTFIVEQPWWNTTSSDLDRNGIFDSLQTVSGLVNVGLSYDHRPTESDIATLNSLGYEVQLELLSVDSLLLGGVDASQVFALAELDGVVMVERYGSVVFFGDVQTTSIKARNSTEYPVGAWELGVSGKGVNIAMTDTGVDNEHPGLVGKFKAGFDAVCYLHSDVPRCLAAGSGAREDDGSFDPDDGNQHGTACMGMASATGLEADGTQSNFTGSAPDAGLVDVRIGTDVGAGPFENYLTEQEAYESAMNGIQWIIDNANTEWAGVEAEDYGIDILSLSWGITSHETGGSDGNEMHSRLLDESMEAGVIVSVAAGNDGPSNDGLSGMGASSLSVTVGATDDRNTITRSDDTIADYSSRGPRRDNGDGNPIDELKPDVSAPGTNIIQSEACVTSGGCNNNLPGQDASANSYTGRGSGTSYATPAVSGVMALMIEANPELEPLQIKEILRVTAEPRGGATYPEIDPIWNQDFGWGMVDALAAVEMAIQLNMSEVDLENLDLEMQLRGTFDEVNGSVYRIDGIAWARTNSVSVVQYRIDGGDWIEASYEIGEEGSTALVPFNWSVALDVDKLSKGNHSIEIRAVGPEGESLPLTYTVMGTGMSTSDSSSSLGRILFLVGLFVLILAAGAFASLKQIKENAESCRVSVTVERLYQQTHEETVLDAELVTEESTSG